MASEVSTQDIESAAAALLENRIASVRVLARTRQVCVDKRAELAAAEREDAAAFAAAQRAGWTVEELKRVGLDQPARRGPGRPRRVRVPPIPPARAPETNGVPSQI